MNIEQLLDISRVEVTLTDIKIDKDFVKRFKEKYSMSSIILANIFGVTKKTVEKWENGEKSISGSSAVLFKVLDDNPEILSQLYTVKVVESQSKKKLKIPKKYMWQGSYEKGGYRTKSPIGKEIDKKKLEEIECPCCGAKNLRIKDYGCDSMFPEYQVGCDSCDWDSPTGTITDYGEAPCEFKWWLEAFELLGRPVEKVNEDLTLYFYPEGEWREKERLERMSDEE